MKTKAVLTIKNKSEVLYLHLKDILYIKADGNYSDVHLVDGSVIEAVSYQRAEIARMLDEQIPEKLRRKFVMVGKSYLVNTEYILRIQPGRQRLTFRTNIFGSTMKVTVNATKNALNELKKYIEANTDKSLT